MTREEKILLAIEKGITCDPITGKVYGVRGKELTAKSNEGYIRIYIAKDCNEYSIAGHQFIWYCVHKQIVDCIDHINGIKDDNRIDNLRSVTNQQNQHNRKKSKGYSWHKQSRKWLGEIRLDGKSIYLGRFDSEQEARQAYLDAKEIYHII